MNASEWLTIGAFIGAVWMVSLWNETAAALIAGAALIVAFVDSGIAKRFTAPSVTGGGGRKV